ncbi:MAG: D-glycerate dehydrogenase [Desulfovibrionaceae bacterium]|nr:D-glycerate dehydrogenase [Desulfovibrionaceae bacterium]MBF0514869.1 D-glycerate dehydrogenase [Desulfovibrionaceae bacterium]
MSKPKVYVTRMIPEPGLALLREHCLVAVNDRDRPLAREELLANVRDAEGVIGQLTDKIDAGFFDAAARLKGYANYAVGYDNIDVAEASRRRLPVSNTPDVLTRATAELAWALLFAVARRIVETDAVMRSGAWPGWGPLQFLGLDVSGKTLGILGPGRIGQAMALMSQGFAMTVLYHGGSKPALAIEEKLGARRVDFDTLLAESDFISIHAPLTPASRRLFGAEAFAKMKRTAVIVNTSRGPVIDEAALAVALREKTIAGAGLDVYEFEPKMAEGLRELQNVVVTPHIGSATRSTRDNMALLAARNLLAMLRGDTPPTCLNPEVLGKK